MKVQKFYFKPPILEIFIKVKRKDVEEVMNKIGCCASLVRKYSTYDLLKLHDIIKFKRKDPDVFEDGLLKITFEVKGLPENVRFTEVCVSSSKVLVVVFE